MRRVSRLPLPARVSSYLDRRQQRADSRRAAGTLNVESEWRTARQTRTMGEVRAVLGRMMGPRERCTYCLDSHGTDMEHFWPKSRCSDQMFRWPNLLLCCTECGRLKGDRFPLQHGVPLLIDPTQENPWQHIDFDPSTGNLTARYEPQADAYSVKGEATVSLLQLDGREALAAGYLKTWRRLVRVAQTFLARGEPAGADFAQVLREVDEDHGLLGWCFEGTGQREPPFRDLRERAPEVWVACVQAIRGPGRPP